MTDNRLILASGSPRRRQLLELIGVDFVVKPADVDETPLSGEDPVTYASRAARDKALEVAAHQPGRMVLGADTVVEADRKILGKPSSIDDATKMLERLSGRSHLVHTALTLVTDTTAHEVVDSARVQFLDLSDEMIQWYVATGERGRTPGAPPARALRRPQSGFLEQAQEILSPHRCRMQDAGCRMQDAGCTDSVNRCWEEWRTVNPASGWKGGRVNPVSGRVGRETAEDVMAVEIEHPQVLGVFEIIGDDLVRDPVDGPNPFQRNLMGNELDDSLVGELGDQALVSQLRIGRQDENGSGT
jgi:septum formation protein